MTELSFPNILASTVVVNLTKTSY